MPRVGSLGGSPVPGRSTRHRRGASWRRPTEAHRLADRGHAGARRDHRRMRRPAHAAADGVEYVMLGFIESEFIPGAFTVPAVRRIASVTLGLGVAGVIWYLLAHEDREGAVRQEGGERGPTSGRPSCMWCWRYSSSAPAPPSGARSRRASWAPCWRSGSATSSISVTAKADAHGVLDRRMVVAVAAGAGLGGVYTRRWPACSSRWRYSSST